MNRADQFKPTVIRFLALLFEEGKRIVFEIPDEWRKEVRSLVKVEGTVNGHPFRAQTDAIDVRVLVRVNAAMLRGARAAAGDTVEVALLGPEPEPIPPEDLSREFAMSPEASQTWEALSELGKRDWIRWIEDAKKPETRARRVARTVEQLSNGKRRACCVDVNGFMMCRIKEDDEARSVQHDL